MARSPRTDGRTAASQNQPSSSSTTAGDTPDEQAPDEHVIGELSKVFSDREKAVMLAAKAGFPKARMPDFRTPHVFWAQVVEEARGGVLTGGVQPVLEKAADMYPANEVFARAVEDARTVHREQGLHGGPLHAPTPGSISARLEAAYLRREELAIAGEDTTEIDSEILMLRREQRRGPTLHAGEFLEDGRFRLVEVVGRGGFAIVWKAYDRTKRCLVAIKVLHGQFVQDASRRERLFRGARKMAELQHPNVVRVLVPEGEEQGFYFYVMEYIAGGDLHQAIANSRIDTAQSLAIIDSIADALEAAHKLGLVHRDVKPQNILLRESGTPALTDFDLVQARDTTGGTRTGALGTVLYSAPEQNDDASTVDHRADIYSLGMTAVFCVYGKKLPIEAMFARDAFLTALSCKAGIRAALQRAVALNPADRFETMTGFRVSLVSARHAPADTPSERTGRDEKRTGSRREVIEAPRGGVELVRIPGGKFLMGSPEGQKIPEMHERPQHEVELVSFYLAKTPITNAQYWEYLKANPKAEKPKHWGDRRYNQDEQPVVGVSWDEARRYCEWAGLRLPTEAQWEYACRAGTTTRYYSGDSEDDLVRVGWHVYNSGNRLHPVGRLEPNGFGLYDMHGNVYEWCEDGWDGDYNRAVHRPGDGLRTKPEGYDMRILRGGGFGGIARFARSAYRRAEDPNIREPYVGFRAAQ